MHLLDRIQYMSDDGLRPKYHPDTLEEMVHLTLTEIGRRVDDLADGNTAGMVESLTSLMRTLQALAPDLYPALESTIAPRSGAHKVVAIMAPLGDDEWSRCGIIDLLDIKAWQALRVTPQDASEYRAAGLTPFDVYEWDMEDAENIVRYRQAGLGPKEVVPRVARSVGVTADDALDTVGFLPAGDVTASALRAALLWRKGFPYDVTVDSYPAVEALARHMGPEEATRWGIPLADIAAWLRMGHTRATFEALTDDAAGLIDAAAPPLYNPAMFGWRDPSPSSPSAVDEAAAAANWERADVARADLPSVSWRLYTYAPFRMWVRFVHDSADFAELYIEDLLVGFFGGEPDELITKLSDAFRSPNSIEFSDLKLTGTLIRLRNAGWDIEASPKGDLQRWYEFAPPAYYGLPSAQLHAVLGRHHFGATAPDRCWVDVTLRRGEEQVNVAVTTSGEVLVMVTPDNDELGVWGNYAAIALEHLWE